MAQSKTLNLGFENLWKKDAGELRNEIVTIWKQFNPSLEGEKAEQRLNQLAWVVKNEFGQVVGLSTAYKAYVKQLRNYLYAVRLLVIPGYRMPGLTSTLLVKTRDMLESIYLTDLPDQCIGIITLVENEEIKKKRNEAIWRASRMVYIGNSSKGHHIRVYYFKGALI